MDQPTVATVCARGGSKGVPDKHLYRLGGETLAFRAVRQALESEAFDVVAFSSDSARLLAEAERAGAHVLIERPEHLASDQSGKLPAIRHAVTIAEGELSKQASVIADIDASAPLRSIEDIHAALQPVTDGEAQSVLTASPSLRSPYFNQVEVGSDGEVRLPVGPTDILARQAAPPVFDLTGAVYVWTREQLFNGRDHVVQPGVRLHVIPKERAWDIDEPVDVRIVGALAGEPLEPPEPASSSR